jgi:hypothetical protein
MAEPIVEKLDGVCNRCFGDIDKLIKDISEQILSGKLPYQVSVTKVERLSAEGNYRPHTLYEIILAEGDEPIRLNQWRMN